MGFIKSTADTADELLRQAQTLREVDGVPIPYGVRQEYKAHLRLFGPIEAQRMLDQYVAAYRRVKARMDDFRLVHQFNPDALLLNEEEKQPVIRKHRARRSRKAAPSILNGI